MEGVNCPYFNLPEVVEPIEELARLYPLRPIKAKHSDFFRIIPFKKIVSNVSSDSDLLEIVNRGTFMNCSGFKVHKLEQPYLGSSRLEYSVTVENSMRESVQAIGHSKAVAKIYD